jgi:hypothetical protein
MESSLSSLTLLHISPIKDFGHSNAHLDPQIYPITIQQTDVNHRCQIASETDYSPSLLQHFSLTIYPSPRYLATWPP